MMTKKKLLKNGLQLALEGQSISEETLISILEKSELEIANGIFFSSEKVRKIVKSWQKQNDHHKSYNTSNKNS